MALLTLQMPGIGYLESILESHWIVHVHVIKNVQCS